MRTYFLKTKRLAFSTWNENDINLAISLWEDKEVTKFISSNGKLTEEEVNIRLQKEIETYKKYNIQYWPMFLIENNDFVGCCGLRPYDLAKNIYEIGFHIRKCFWGQKYAYESATAIIEYAFKEINANALFAGHNPKNTASKKLLEKLGFKYTHDEFYKPTGLNHPSYLLSK